MGTTMSNMIQMKPKDIKTVKEKLLKKQKGLCLICKRNLYELPSRNICLDHCHTTWMVRGVLCRACNSLEGKFKRNFIRVGAKNKGIIYTEFLKGLVKFQARKDTNYRYPEKPKRRKRKAKAKAKPKE